MQVAYQPSLTLGVCSRTADRRLLYRSLLTVVRSAGVNKNSCTWYLRQVEREHVVPVHTLCQRSLNGQLGVPVYVRHSLICYLRLCDRTVHISV